MYCANHSRHGSPSPHPIFSVLAPTYFSQQNLSCVPVSSALIDEAYPYHSGHLHIVGDIQLCWSWWQKGRYVDAQKASNGHIHCAQLGSRNAKQQSNTCHLMALRKETNISNQRKQTCSEKEKHLPQCSIHPSQWAVHNMERFRDRTAENLLNRNKVLHY